MAMIQRKQQLCSQAPQIILIDVYLQMYLFNNNNNNNNNYYYYYYYYYLYSDYTVKVNNTS
jgi:hypothetical protein